MILITRFIKGLKKIISMNKKTNDIINFFNLNYSHAKCSLNYTTDYSLLIAIMLSAQCSDKKVNQVTDLFFSKYKSLEEINKLSLEEIEGFIKPLGLYKNKSIYLKNIVHDLIFKFHGKVPNNKKEIMSLPGVGNKTANVFLVEWFKIPEFPVDTHIKRISKRLDLVNETDDVLTIENKLKEIFPKENWINLHHQIIFFGREQCKALNPRCEDCYLKKYCSYYRKNYQ